ncbi:hypothetical protein Tco_1577339 [Tanacetum coccineum]
MYSPGNIMDEINIDDLTIEQYFKLTQENHAPSVGMKVEDMTIAEYMEYEETIKTQDYDGYQTHSTKAGVSTRQRDHLNPCDWFEAELEKCWKIQQKRDKSYLNPWRQAQEDALRNWEAQIIQLRKQEHEDNQLHDELKYGAYNTIGKPHWCEPVRQEHKRGYIFWATCDPYHEICDGGGISNKKIKHYWKSTNDDDRVDLEWEGLSYTNWVRAREKTIMEDREDPKECGETMTRAIIRAMVNKLPEEWVSRVSEDKDDLEGIIDYLEPTLYDGFIDPDNEAYKQRRNKLLGMPYTEPPLILKEEDEITRYNLGLEKSSQKLKS